MKALRIGSGAFAKTALVTWRMQYLLETRRKILFSSACHTKNKLFCLTYNKHESIVWFRGRLSTKIILLFVLASLWLRRWLMISMITTLIDGLYDYDADWWSLETKVSYSSKRSSSQFSSRNALVTSLCLPSVGRSRLKVENRSSIVE